MGNMTEDEKRYFEEEEHRFKELLRKRLAETGTYILNHPNERFVYPVEE